MVNRQKGKNYETISVLNAYHADHEMHWNNATAMVHCVSSLHGMVRHLVFCRNC